MIRAGILVIDYGSQYNQLIARRVREHGVYCRIVTPSITMKEIESLAPEGIILSGGPASVYADIGPTCDKKLLKSGIPILGICYGMQLITNKLGGVVKKTRDREYGRAQLFIDRRLGIFENMPKRFISWMSHGDYVSKMPDGFVRLAHTSSTKFAGICHLGRKIYGVQFHPEVLHTEHGSDIIKNFLFKVCGCKKNWDMRSFVKSAVKDIRGRVGNSKVVLGLSGGVDSSVTAAVIHKAVGKKLYCIYVDNGLMRKNETKRVKELFRKNMKLNLITVDAGKIFLMGLNGVMNPEKKRKIIGRTFIKVFEREARKVGNVKYLAQGTLYPDVIESVSAFGGPTAVIKSHHNVGGLPEKMGLRLLEPLRELFKDEVRVLGKELGLPKEILWRQPFPGPGLAVRIIGEVTKERLDILREADSIIMDEMKRFDLYYKVWQSFAVLLPVKTVGVMGDERTYESVLAVRAVNSHDGMTADWVRLPYEVLEVLSSRIINEVKGINRVVYDTSSKPPSTIEWE